MSSVGNLDDLPELRASMDAEKQAGSKIFVYPADFFVNVQTRMGAYLNRINESNEDDAYKTFYHCINFIRQDKDKRIEIPDDLYWGFVRYYRSRVAYNPNFVAKPVIGQRLYEGNVVSLYQLQRILRTKEGEDETEISEIIIRGFRDKQNGQWIESLMPVAWAKMRDETLWELEKFQYPIEHLILYKLEENIGDWTQDDDDSGYMSDGEASLIEQDKIAKKLAEGWKPPNYDEEEHEEEEGI